jgi:hypothetical protein
MSIVGILASSALSLLTPSAQNPTKTLKQNFQQLGQDLKSGNLSAAQSDFTALQQNVTASASAVPSPQAAASPSTAISQDFAKLSIDLQSGNLTGAQADYNSILQSFQTEAAQSLGCYRTSASSSCRQQRRQRFVCRPHKHQLRFRHHFQYHAKSRRSVVYRNRASATVQ